MQGRGEVVALAWRGGGVGLQRSGGLTAHPLRRRRRTGCVGSDLAQGSGPPTRCVLLRDAATVK
ncbi:hypothetical protein E2562_009479 [Oryza meyeriana var. granulata]|uniref:Uncharacterized protein n=1 Tax=Oryza meyeriana var. granulata TaxID=110450 RepID=A0A6G1BUG8_9ORYZ|nr:hypothetical protein E2562_009479 [Oryza meyeriana var. granulata]